MEHISPSQISMFRRCPEQWYQRYVEGRVMPPQIAMIKGSSVHKGAEINHRQKIETREDLPRDQIVEQAVADYEARAGDELLLDEGKSRADQVGEGKDSVASLAGLYADEVAPSIMPVMVEERILTPIDGAPPLLTIIDVADEAGYVRDLKTAGKSKNQKEADESFQLSCYALAYQERTGQLPAGMSLDVMVETKTPKYQRLNTVRGPEIVAPTIAIIYAVLDAIQKGVFLPPAEGSWVCDPRWCGYYGSCNYTGKRRF